MKTPAWFYRAKSSYILLILLLLLTGTISFLAYTYFDQLARERHRSQTLSIENQHFQNISAKIKKLEIIKYAEDIPVEPFSLSPPLAPSGKNSDTVEINKHVYRRKIVLETKFSEKDFYQHPVLIDINTLQWIRESKLPIDTENIYFTDDDGSTILPHHVAYGYGQKTTRVWVNIPHLKAKHDKSIYIYYSFQAFPSALDSTPPFPKSNSLIGWYVLDDALSKDIYDLSGNNNHGGLSRLDFYMYWHMGEFKNEPTYYTFFNDWERLYNFDNDSYAERQYGKSLFFSVPTEKHPSIARRGALELWIKPYHIMQDYTQQIVINDKENFSIGLLHNGGIYLQAGNPNNKIHWDANIKQGYWYHIVVNWDFETKNTQLFVYGKEIQKARPSTNFQWQALPELGKLHFGGYHAKNKLLGFSGYLEAIRIYDKTLTQSEVKLAHQLNHRKYYLPKAKIGEKEIAKSNETINKSINFAQIQKLPTNPGIRINTLYTTPLSYFEKRVDIYPSPRRTTGDLINKIWNFDWYQPIFGISSHFFSHIGTEVSIDDHYLLQYMGLRVNNPDLIKDMKISFSWYVDYNDLRNQKEYNSWKVGWLNWLIPIASACAPLYSYKDLGESHLELVNIDNQICWYKLKEPFLVGKSASIMQMEYLTVNQPGVIEIQLKEMVFLDSNQDWQKATLFIEKPKTLDLLNDHLNTMYIANLDETEKGSVELQITEKNDLALCFKNIGQSYISFDDDSYFYIAQNLLDNIHVKNQQGKLLSKFSLKDLMTINTERMKIPPNYCLRLPLLEHNEIAPNQTYEVYLLRAENPLTPPKPYKIISWIINDNPYEYFSASSRSHLWKKLQTNEKLELSLID
jgi:hypothetical protein